MIKQAPKRFHGSDSIIVCPYFSDATKMKGIIWGAKPLVRGAKPLS